MNLVYLASPYSHPTSKAAQEYRAIAAAKLANAKTVVSPDSRNGIVIYSPIAAHYLEARELNLPANWEYWSTLDKLWIRNIATEVWIYCIDGWEISRGVFAEAIFAAGLGKPVAFFDPADDALHALPVGSGIRHRHELSGIREGVPGETSVARFLINYRRLKLDPSIDTFAKLDAAIPQLREAEERQMTHG